ncbi:SGNH/GDSL hydrolase family protein [Beggiatoa leptomitoformis]|uniref:SGNH/GDSL hydrolase family protein n=1 Tax=Beggiatoa leptomitoformis TaxID=288004 RepID=A0A2N9YBV7_9GAMM|nr:SGNH/GDSL hydrolase family protein [Beggiatoa leptomitoformis]ALG66707.2 hypothetical protein AL038_01930 [Beggiatoa leptomitoformis]AUI67963.2 hypothetical protein BLE401_04105 [Beggiatoa leptomitoformis]
MLLFFLEIGAYLLVVRSDSFSFTLANKRWFSTYWQPINALGYRDDDYSPEEVKSNRLIFVVGDSFVAGQGIKNYQQRFSNLLREKLGKGWLVANIAQVGWSTSEEYQGIINYPYQPNVIILAYFIDDIRQAATQPSVINRLSHPQLIQSVPTYLQGLVDNSYLANYFYWQWYRSHYSEPESIYWTRMQSYYADSEVWALHQQELKNIVDYAKQHQIILIPVLFPNLISLDNSQPILQKVASWLTTLGTQPIDLSYLFKGKTPRELVVNQVDAHPNEWVNQQVSEVLLKLVQERVK